MIPAKSEVIDLYRLLYKADHPMTLDEIAGVGGMNTVYQTFAYVAYKEHLAEEMRRDYERREKVRGKEPIHPSHVKNEKWSEAERHTAWRWWLSRLIHSSVDTKRVSVDTRDGSPVRGKRQEDLLYSANRDNPPYVRKRVDASRIVPWEPDLDQVTDRHIAGMQFLQQADSILQQKKLPADIKKALTLAVKAIREGEAQ